MFKVCTLDVLLASGELKSLPFATSAPAESKAREVRASGLLDGEPVAQGMVRASGQLMPKMRFSCKPVAAPEQEKRARKK